MKRIIRLCKTLRKGALQVNEHHTENLIPPFLQQNTGIQDSMALC